MFSRHKSEAQEPLTDFFERLNAPLQKMPVQDRAELHTEMRQHLDALVAAHLELGASPVEALDAAIKQFGSPRKTGKNLFREWQRTQGASRSFLRTLLVHAAGVISWLLVLEACAYGMFPTPEAWLLVVPPITIGLIWGRIGPRQLRHSLFSANLIIFLSSLLFAIPFILFPPNREILTFYQIPICCWLPLTSLAVYVSSRCRTFSFKVRGTPDIQPT